MAQFQELVAVLEFDPANPGVWQQLEAIAPQSLGQAEAATLLEATRKMLRERGELEVVARLFDVEIAAVREPGRRADLLLQKGQLFAEELLNEEGAVACLNEVLKLRPDDETAQETLAHIDLVRENWQKFVQKYLEEAKVSTDRQLTTQLFLSAAETYARYQPGAAEIEQYLRRALEVDGRNRRAAIHLERLLRRDGRWKDLLEHLEQRVEAAASKEERVQALLGIAELASTKLHRADLNLDAMRKVVGHDPAHPRALRVLADHYEQEQNWTALVMLFSNALKVQRRGASPEGDVGTLLQIAMLHWKRLGNLDAAEEYFRRLRKVDQAHPAALAFYREYYGARNEGAKLLQMLKAARKVASDPELQKSLAVEIASMAEGELGNPEKAIESWKAILKNEPHNEAARAALERLYRKTEGWNKLLDLIKEEIGRLPEGETGRRIQRLMEVVEIYRDKLKLDVMVINTYNAILKLDPFHRQALDELAEKYKQLGRWNDLIAVLSKKAEDTRAPVVERAANLREVASLWSERFGNYAQAIRPLEQLLEIDPSDPGARAQLKDIYTRRRQWRALITLLGREVEELPPAERRSGLVHMAHLAADRLGDQRLAIDVWNRVLELSQPAHPERRAGEAGPEPKADDAEALAALAQLYDREKRYLGLAEILRRQADAARAAGDRAGALGLLEKLGVVYAERLQAPALAAETLRGVLALAPDNARALRTLRDLHGVAGDWDGLEKMYGELGHWEELVDAFIGFSDRLEGREAKLALLERAARVAAARFDHPEKIARAWERVLAVDAQHREAAAALAPLYRKTEKWARLLNVYEILLAHAGTGAERLDLHLQIRGLCEQQLGSKALAFQWTARAFELRPDDPQLLVDLERLGAEADAWAEVAEILDRRVASELAPAQRLPLLRELGKISLQRLHQPDRARAYQRRVLELAPDDTQALAALEEIASQLADWPDLLAVFRRRVQLEKNPDARVELLFRIAFLEEERIADLDAAAATYTAILDHRPDSQRALKALCKIEEARGDWDGLARALERTLAQSDDDAEQLDVLLRVGKLYESNLGRMPEALRCFRRAFDLAPHRAEVRDALERFIEPGRVDDERRGEIAALLLPQYEQRDDAARVARALEVLRLRAAPAEAADHDRRLIRLYGDRLSDPASAFTAAVRLLRAQPADDDARAALLRHGAALDRSREMATELAQARSAKGVNAATRRAIAADLARVQEDRLSDTAEAEKAWLDVLADEPTDAAAYEALDRIYRAAERWKDLRDLLLQREKHTMNGAQRVTILLQVCEIEEGPLDNKPGAIAAYRRVLELDPAYERGYKALERLYEEAEQWKELEALCAAELAHVEGQAQIDLTYKRAHLLARHLGDREAAVDLLQEVVTAQRGHADARELLEELLPAANLRLRIARLLEPLYEQDGLWRDLVLVLRAQREYAGGHEAVGLLSRIARVEEEQLGHERGAFDTWREAFAADPGDDVPRQALLRLGSLLGRWDEVAAAWEQAAARIPDTDLSLRATLFGELADIYDRHLADAVRAAGAYERLLDADPGNPETARPAALALDRLYSEEQRWPQLIDIVHRQAEWASEPAERCRLLARIAEVQEQQLHDTAAAVATWREVLGEDPEDERALDALERLFSAAGAHRDLAEVLHRRVEKALDPQEKKAQLRRIAGLYERELGNPGEAVNAHLEVLDHLPDDRDTLAELARLHRAAGRWLDLYETVERQLHGAADDAQRVELTYELAVLLQDRLDRSAEALDRLAEVLAAQPQGAATSGALAGALARLEGLLDHRDLGLRAGEVLQPIYERSGEHHKLAGLLGRTAAASDDLRERLRALVRVAELREHRLNDAAGAFDAYAQAARAAATEPELPELLGQLDRLSGALGREADLIAIFEAIAPDILDGDLQRRLYLDIADLARALRQDTNMARRYYQKVLDAEPEDRRALLALESIYRESGEYGLLHEILIRKAEIATTTLDERVMALSEAANLCAGPLNRTDDAIAAWEQVLELVPGSKEAAAALEKLYEKGERWHELVGVIERRLGYAYTVEEAVALRFRLGEIHEKHLLAPDAAVDNYAAALGGDPAHAGATTALERALDDPGTRASAAEVLEPIYVAHQDWAKLVRIYEIKLEASENPDERLALSRYISRLYEDQLEDLEGAFRWCGRVFREDPRDESVRDQLSRLATVLEAWSGLANIYQEYLDDETADSSEVRDIALDLAQLYDRRLGEIELGQAAYRRALRIQPDDPDTFERLTAMLSRAGRWYALVDVYQEAIGATMDDRRRIDLYMRLARLLRDRLNDAPGAVDAFRAALEIEPDHPQSTAELEALFEAQSKWHDLAEMLAQRIERAATDQARVQLRLRLADLMETRLKDPQSAIDQYEQILAIPDGWEQALPSLERLVVDEACRERITEILEPVYRQQDWWQKLVVILQARLDYIDDPQRRTVMLREIATIHERRGGDLRLALQALAEAWKMNPADESLGDDLSALAARLGAWSELVATLEAGIVEQYDYDLVARVLAQIAEIHETKRGDNPAAIAAWKRLLEASEDDPVGLSALDRLYTAEARWDELVDVVQRRADRAEETPVRRVLLHRVAEIEEGELGNLTNAIAAWKAALGVDDADREALDALERLYTHEEEWRELAGVLGRKIELGASEAERRPLRFAAARVHDDKLHDAYEAMAQINEILAAAPADLEALDALVAIQQREKMWPELVDTLDRRAALEATPAARAELAFRAARVVEVELTDPEGALGRHEAVLALQPAHAGARAALDALTRNEDTLEQAAVVLERLYTSEGGHDAVAALYERRLAGRGGDAETRQQWYARLAEVHEVARGDLGAAFAVWARALAEAPDRAEVQGQLERLAASRGNWDALAEIYEQRLRDVVDADLEHLYSSKLGSLYEDALGDLGRAAERYRRALDVASDERPLLTALDRVYGRAGRFADLGDILVREAEASNDPGEQAELWFRLGDIREQNLDDIAAAVAAYREVLERAPRHSAARGALERLLAQDRERAEVISILEPLYESEGDWGRLIDLLAAKLGVTDDHMDRAQVYARIAELAEGKLGDAVRALDAAGGWLAEDPASEKALAEVERLAEACGRWDEVAARLAGIIESADSFASSGQTGDEIRLPLLLELGEVELGLRRSKEAEATFRRALAIDDESGPALAALDRIYRERGDAGALAEVVWRRGELAMDAPHKRRCFVEAAGLREQLGDLDGAIKAWREVLDLDESDRDAHGRLAALYDKQQSFPELIEVLGIAARFAADKQEEVALRARAARIHATQGNLDEAVDGWQAVLDVAPDDVEALAALHEVHTRREDWLAVQEVLVRRLELARTNPERIAIYTELAELAAGKRDSVDEAVGYYYQVLDLDNAHFATYRRLEEILTGAERWHDLVELMQRLAEVYGALGQTREEVGCYARAADVWEGKLDNPDAAGEILEKIIAREPRYVPALTRLARIYESAGDWDKCGEVLQRAVALGPTGADAADLYFRLGEVERQRSGDMEAALRHWARALQFDPGHAHAVEAFEREARERQDWGVVADMVARREAAASDARKKLELLLELADLYGKRLGQPQQVVPLLERASAQAPTDPRVIGPLADAYFAAGDIARAAPIYEKLAEEAKAGRRMKEVAMFRQRLGGIFEARGEQDRALEAYEEAFRVNPTDVATMAGLGRIYMGRQDWEKARRVYRSLVLQNIDPGAGVTKAEVYYHLGMIHIHLGEGPKAKGMFQRGLELEPDNELLKRALTQAG